MSALRFPVVCHNIMAKVVEGPFAVVTIQPSEIFGLDPFRGSVGLAMDLGVGFLTAWAIFPDRVVVSVDFGHPPNARAILALQFHHHCVVWSKGFDRVSLITGHCEDEIFAELSFFFKHGCEGNGIFVLRFVKIVIMDETFSAFQRSTYDNISQISVRQRWGAVDEFDGFNESWTPPVDTCDFSEFLSGNFLQS
jgi:hypothetical protein